MFHQDFLIRLNLNNITFLKIVSAVVDPSSLCIQAFLSLRGGGGVGGRQKVILIKLFRVHVAFLFRPQKLPNSMLSASKNGFES